MTDEFKFNIGDSAVSKILELKDQEPGDKDYALFLQIDGVQGNQYTYDLSFLDLEQARPDDKRIDFGDLSVVIASKDVDNFNGAELEISDDPNAPGLTMDNPNTPSPSMVGNPEDCQNLQVNLLKKSKQFLKAKLIQQLQLTVAKHP